MDGQFGWPLKCIHCKTAENAEILSDTARTATHRPNLLILDGSQNNVRWQRYASVYLNEGGFFSWMTSLGGN